jgi:hypothetical protein
MRSSGRRKRTRFFIRFGFAPLLGQEHQPISPSKSLSRWRPRLSCHGNPVCGLTYDVKYRLPLATDFWWLTMVGNAVLWFLVLVAACQGSILPRLPPAADERKGHPDNGVGGAAGPWRKPGYVRMPVSRQKFNGTGKEPGQKHTPPPRPPPASGQPQHDPPHQHTPAEQQRDSIRPTTATKLSPIKRDSLALEAQPLAPRQGTNSRRWGWSSLEELGGIAYIIQRGQSLRLLCC